MNKELTEIIFILDRSGSMHGMEADTIGGFNSIIEKQRLESGKAVISTVLFNNRAVVIHDRIPLEDIRPMTEAEFTVGGCTALLDALGASIHHIGMVHKYIRPEDVPAHTMFVIMTDGMENASRKYSSEEVRKMIEDKKSGSDWEFVFLASNIDAVETARHYGIDERHSVNYYNDSTGAAVTFNAVNEAISIHRSTGKLASDSWRESVDKDYMTRKK